MSGDLAHIRLRIRPLSPRHRLAHLCALIRREPQGSMRAGGLAALLRDQLSMTAANEDRSI
jgi:hypothetical protein